MPGEPRRIPRAENLSVAVGDAVHKAKKKKKKRTDQPADGLLYTPVYRELTVCGIVAALKSLLQKKNGT